MSTIKIVLADDHRIVREGLSALLRQQPDFELVGEAEDGLAAVKLARTLQPDVVVTDISMPGLNGVEAVRRIHLEEPGVKVLCLSVHDETAMVLSVIDAGAAGYVLKDASFEELVRAIRQVMTHRIYLSPALVGIFVEKYRTREAPEPQVVAASPLTAREREVVQLFSEGYSSNEIATRLNYAGRLVLSRDLTAEELADVRAYHDSERRGRSSLQAVGAVAVLLLNVDAAMNR